MTATTDQTTLDLLDQARASSSSPALCEILDALLAAVASDALPGTDDARLTAAKLTLGIDADNYYDAGTAQGAARKIASAAFALLTALDDAMYQSSDVETGVAHRTVFRLETAAQQITAAVDTFRASLEVAS